MGAVGGRGEEWNSKWQRLVREAAEEAEGAVRSCEAVTGAVGCAGRAVGLWL